MNELEKERHRKASARYRANHPERVKEAARRYREKNPEKERRRSHPEQCRRPPEYYAAWRKKNPEKARAIVARYNAANPEKKRVRVRNRRARLRGAPGSHTAEDIKRLLELQKGKCAHPWCRASLQSGYQVDHKEAVATGGSNGPENLQLLCAPCNQSKHTKSPIELANRNGFLL